MKRILLLILTLCIILTLGTIIGCSAENANAADALSITLQIDNPMITVNGAEKEIDPGRETVPVILNDRTFVPVRTIVEEMGGSVSWNEDTQTASLSYNGDEIRLTIDSRTAYFNDEAHTLDVAPTVINDRTMLPIRFVAESFKFDVVWNEEQQLITITKNMQNNAPTEPETKPTAEPKSPEKNGGTLVVYFSATGNTKSLAEKIAAVAEADLVEIVPAEPYTSEDLNYNNNNCRANLEMNDDSARPAISNTIQNIDSYDTIMLGYPIWWGTMPKIINTFLDTYDLSGKTIMPFCTSGSSGISSSVSVIESICTNSTVTDGFRGSASVSDSQIKEWLDNNNYAKATPNISAQQQKIRLSWRDKEAVIALEENATTADFLSKLPMTVKFEDYNHTEKISRLDEEILKDASAYGCDPKEGTFALYVPWGNLSLFYKDWSYSDDLIPMGEVEFGLEQLTAESEEFTVTIETID